LQRRAADEQLVLAGLEAVAVGVAVQHQAARRLGIAWTQQQRRHGLLAVQIQPPALDAIRTLKALTADAPLTPRARPQQPPQVFAPPCGGCGLTEPRPHHATNVTAPAAESSTLRLSLAGSTTRICL
jgi:hypothetical protein